MFACSDPQALTEFLSDRLDGHLSAQIDQHVATCGGCQRVLESLTVSGLHSSSALNRQVCHSVDVPGDVMNRILRISHLMGRSDSVDDNCETLDRDTAHDEEVTIIDVGSDTKTRAGDDHSPAAKRGQSISRFRVISQIAEGGFGTVFLAVDASLKREVALKLLDHPWKVTDSVRRRFHREAVACARLSHPNIVSLLDAGEENGHTFLVMPYCPGLTLKQWLGKQTVPVEVRMGAEILRQLASGVGHAHRQDCIHRDIKPANILLSDDVPSENLSFTPRLTDFGLAVLMDDTHGHSTRQAIAGTPRYMAPEQASGNWEQIGPATDVYALGVVLYELLTGQTPVEGENNADTLRRVLMEVPKPPTTIRPNVPRDLESICLKCLNDDPTKRYLNADALEKDLARFLRDEPTVARPLSPRQRALRVFRHHPVATVTWMLLGFMCVGSLIGLTGHNRSISTLNAEIGTANSLLKSRNTELNKTVESLNTTQATLHQQNEQLRDLAYVREVQLIDAAVQRNDVRTAAGAVTRVEQDSELKDRLGVEWRILRQKCFKDCQSNRVAEEAFYDVCATDDGGVVAAAGQSGWLRLFDSRSLQQIDAVDTEQIEVNCCVFSSDSRTVLTSGDDGSVCIWAYPSGRLQKRIQVFDQSAAFRIQMLPNDEFLVCGRHQNFVRFRMNGERVREFAGHADWVEDLCVSPNGQYVASVSTDQTVAVWDLNTGRLKWRSMKSRHRLFCVAWLHGGQSLVSAGADRTITIHAAETGDLLHQVSESDIVQSLAVSNSGDLLAVGTRQGTISIWSVDRQSQLAPTGRWHAHDGRVYAMCFSTDDRTVLSAGSDGKVSRTLHTPRSTNTQFRSLPYHVDSVLCSDSNQKTRLLGINRNRVLCWNVPEFDLTAELVSPSADQVEAVVMTKDGRHVYGSTSGNVRLFKWDVNRPDAAHEFPSPYVSERAGIVVNADGRYLAVQVDVQNGSHFQLFDTVREKWLTHRAPLKGYCAQFVGNLIVVCNVSNICIWDYQQQWQLACIPHSGASIDDLQISVSGRLAAIAQSDRHAIIIDLEAMTIVHRLHHSGKVTSVAFSSDERTLVTSTDAGQVHAWHVRSGQLLAQLIGSTPRPKRHRSVMRGTICQ